MAELMVSTRQLRGIWGGPGRLAWEIALGAALLALVVLAALWPAAAGEPHVSAWRRAGAAAAVSLVAILAVSRLPVGQHHMATILPPALGALALGAVELRKRWPRSAPVLAAAGAALALAWLSWNVRIERGLLRTGGRGVWSSALEAAVRELRSRPVRPERLKILDWGFQNPLYVLSRGTTSGTELFWGATPERSSRGVAWADEMRDGGVFLLWADDTGSVAARAFRSALAAAAPNALVTDFAGREGEPSIRLVEISATP